MAEARLTSPPTSTQPSFNPLKNIKLGAIALVGAGALVAGSYLIYQNTGWFGQLFGPRLISSYEECLRAEDSQFYGTENEVCVTPNGRRFTLNTATEFPVEAPADLPEMTALQVCPDEWVQQFKTSTGRTPDDPNYYQIAEEYMMYDGQKTFLVQVDQGWIQENCEIEPVLNYP